MKNQYAGDINDFRKYGLIRCLTAPDSLSVFCCWMLTPDDGSSDGRHVSYLQDPAKWRSHDPELFDALGGVFSWPEGRGVEAVEASGVLGHARFLSRVLPDDREGRAAYFAEAASNFSEADLAFFDPDNGLQIPSKSLGNKASSKYLFWDEVTQAYDGGASVLAYQHFPREKRGPYIGRRVNELRSVTGAQWTASFATSHVLFLLAPQLRHEEALMDGCRLAQERWGDQFEVVVHDASEGHVRDHDPPIHGVRTTAAQLQDIVPKDEAVAEVVGLVAGVLYCLGEVRRLGVPPLPIGSHHDFGGELQQVLRDTASGLEPKSERWLAGFFFNSAILRIVFCAERALQIIAPPRTPETAKLDRKLFWLANDATAARKITAVEKDRLVEALDDVNAIKHDRVDVHGRKIRTLDGAERLLPLLQKLLMLANGRVSPESQTD